MKPLTKSTDVNHLYILKDLLEANGIPAFVKGENTARMISPFLMTEPGLWVYLDDQLDEAEALILDPDYQVKHGIDMNEFENSRREISANPRHLNEALIKLGVGISAALLVFFLLIMWLGA